MGWVHNNSSNLRLGRVRDWIDAWLTDWKWEDTHCQQTYSWMGGASSRYGIRHGIFGSTFGTITRHWNGNVLKRNLDQFPTTRVGLHGVTVLGLIIIVEGSLSEYSWVRENISGPSIAKLPPTRPTGWTEIIYVILYCATLCVSAVLAVGRCLSVCLSLRHVCVLYTDG